MNYQLPLALLLLVIVAVAGIVLRQPEASGCPDFSEDTVAVNGTSVSVAVADTAAEKAQGLSGCESVPEGSGMVFWFETRAYPTFWMKDMLIPIDIIWIADGEVIGIERDVQPPPGGTHDGELAVYRPPRPVDAVLEIAAGEARRTNIVVGSEVE